MEQLPSLVESGFRRAFITFTAIICTFLPVINMSVVNVAFLDIRANLGVSSDKLSWVTTVYSLANIVIIPFSSWLSQHLGRRNYFAVAVILFTVCSFFCGNATDIQELVIFRFLEGLGGGSMLVLSHRIITESWPVEKRATSQALFILGILLGITLAQPFGGYITDNYSWSYIFFANIPVGIIACLLILTCVRNGSYRENESLLDNVILAVGTSSLYIVLVRGPHEEWFSSLFIIILSLVGLSGIILFIYRQLLFISPPGEKGLLRNVKLSISLLLYFFMAFGVTVSSMIIISSPECDAQQSAVPLWTTILSVIVILPVTAFLIDKFKVLTYLIVAGIFLFIVHFYILYQAVSGNVSTNAMFWLLTTRSVSIAVLSVSAGTFILSELEGKRLGQGIALYNIIRYLGGALGIALFSISENQ